MNYVDEFVVAFLQLTINTCEILGIGYLHPHVPTPSYRARSAKYG